MDGEVEALFGRLRSGPFSRVGAAFDPGMTAYEGQMSGAMPQGFLDEFDKATADFVLNGIYNGAFQFPPALGAGTTIAAVSNELPFWWGGVTSVSGSAITASWVADSSSPSGYNLRFTFAAGAAGDEVYVEQIVPIAGDRLRAYMIAARTAFYRVTASGGAPLGKVVLQYLKADGTTTGSATTLSTSLITNATLYRVSGAIVNPPSDAASLRVRLGVTRNTMAVGDTATVDVANIRLDRSGSQVFVTESSSPASFDPGGIVQADGTISLYADGDSVSQHVDVLSAGSVQLWAGTQAVLTVDSTHTVDIAGAWRTSAVYNAGAVGADQNNVAIGAVGVVTVSGSGASRNWNGMISTATKQRVIIVNTGTSNNINITHDNAGSTAAYRFYCPGAATYTLAPYESVECWYDSTASRWRVVSRHEAAHTAHDTIWDAKGDLVAGTGADAAAKVTVGADGTVLTADSTQTAGVKWAAAGGGFPGATPTYVRPSIAGNQNNYAPGLSNRCFLEIDCGGAGRTITGFSATPFAEGDVFYLKAIGLGAGVLTLSHKSASSSSGNRITLPGSGAAFTLDFQDIAAIVYLPTLDSANPFHILSANRI